MTQNTIICGVRPPAVGGVKTELKGAKSSVVKLRARMQETKLKNQMKVAAIKLKLEQIRVPMKMRAESLKLKARVK
jgi:hypothetical protein